MFSRRTHWEMSENALSHAVAERRARGLELLDLTETNPTRAGFLLPPELLADAWNAAEALRYSPEPFGLPAAREAISRYHAGRVPAAHVAVGASTSEAYGWLFKLLCDPGDRVLVPAPGYPLFDYLAQLESVHLDTFHTHAWDDWRLDTQTLEVHITPETKAIVVVSPNNPTGAVLSEGDVEALVAVCKRHDLALICDEVFADYQRALPGRVRSLAGESRVLTFVLSGLSKLCLAPQLKAGWIAASGPEPVLSQALARLEIIADSYLSPNTPTQLALPRLLAERGTIQAPLQARLAANRAEIEAICAGTAVSVLPSDGGWSAVLRVPRTRSESEWALQLVDDGVLVHPGFFFDFGQEAFLVVSLLAEERVVAEGVRRIVRRA